MTFLVVNAQLILFIYPQCTVLALKDFTGFVFLSMLPVRGKNREDEMDIKKIRLIQYILREINSSKKVPCHL